MPYAPHVHYPLVTLARARETLHLHNTIANVTAATFLPPETQNMMAPDSRTFPASHERAICDFTTALAVLQPNQKDPRTKERIDGSGNGISRGNFSDAEYKKEGGGGGRGTDSIAAKSEKGGEGGSDTSVGDMLDKRHAPAETGTPCVADQEQSTSDKRRLQEPPGNGQVCRKPSRQDTGRRGSQRGDGGDGMDEGVSVIGACHYAR